MKIVVTRRHISQDQIMGGGGSWRLPKRAQLWILHFDRTGKGLPITFVARREA